MKTKENVDIYDKKKLSHQYLKCLFLKRNFRSHELNQSIHSFIHEKKKWISPFISYQS